MTSPQWLDSWSADDGAARVRTLFTTAFGDDGDPDGVWSAPGRVNLIGEHTDYNAGLALPVALPHRTYVALRSRTDGLVRLASAQAPGQRWETALDEVVPGVTRGWGAYVAGVAWALREAGHEVSGFDAVVDSCVPFGAGLSSSAALECAVAVALDAVHSLGLAADDAGRAELVTACIRAENEIAGAPTGGMDQAASLRCSAGHALLLDCRPGLTPLESAERVPFDLAAAGLTLLVVDTRAEHALVDGQYAQRRAMCEQAAEILGLGSLREIAPDDLDVALDKLAALSTDEDDSDVMRRRVRHVVTEIARTAAFADLVRDGRVGDVGPLMNASHDSLRDDYEVSARELDLVVEAARGAGALGARMTGGGFGGSAIALVRAEDADRVTAAVQAAFDDAGLTAPGFLLAPPSDPAR
jgi:galactokinase